MVLESRASGVAPSVDVGSVRLFVMKVLPNPHPSKRVTAGSRQGRHVCVPRIPLTTARYEAVLMNRGPPRISKLLMSDRFRKFVSLFKRLTMPDVGQVPSMLSVQGGREPRSADRQRCRGLPLRSRERHDIQNGRWAVSRLRLLEAESRLKTCQRIVQQQS